MPFTDDNIERLKIQLDQMNFCECGGNHHKWPLVREINALLHRLECAEAMELYWKYYPPVSEQDDKEYSQKADAWRTAAGKSALDGGKAIQHTEFRSEEIQEHE